MKEHTELEKEYSDIQKNFKITSLIALSVLFAGALFYRLVEDLSWVDSVYFCAITLTTIGYGDIAPVTSLGKIFTIFYAIIGIGIIGTFANLLLRRAVLKRQVANQDKSGR